MRKWRGALGATLLVALLIPGNALAIVNGEPDGDRHPNVGFLAVEFMIEGEPARFPVCSGSYGGPLLTNASEHVFITAAHCLLGPAADGLPASFLVVTYDTAARVDPATSQVVGASAWHRATDYTMDPQFERRGLSALHDYGIVILDDVPLWLAPVDLPTAGLLDELFASGDLRPDVKFDRVGYGRTLDEWVQPPPRRPPGGGGATNVGFGAPPARMLATSLYRGLTPDELFLSQVLHVEDGNGGGCFGDSGSPIFMHETNLAVAINGGGNPLCRSVSMNPRLDTPEARAFYGQYLRLP